MRLALLLAVAVLAAGLAGCGAKKGFEKEGFAYGCPIGDTKVGSMEDLIKSKVSVEGPRTTVQVSGLLVPGCRIEIDLTAVLP